MRFCAGGKTGGGRNRVGRAKKGRNVGASQPKEAGGSPTRKGRAGGRKTGSGTGVVRVLQDPRSGGSRLASTTGSSPSKDYRRKPLPSPQEKDPVIPLVFFFLARSVQSPLYPVVATQLMYEQIFPPKHRPFPAASLSARSLSLSVCAPLIRCPPLFPRPDTHVQNSPSHLQSPPSMLVVVPAAPIHPRRPSSSSSSSSKSVGW